MGRARLRGAPLLAALLTALLRAAAGAPSPAAATQVLNITRIDGGDAFFVTGDECGVTHCGEASGGTALSDRPPGALGPPCACRCRAPLPLFREDRLTCVSDITECPVAEFGSGNGASRVPFVFLPLSGQIIHPSKEINFPEITNAVCAISSAQFLTRTGWSSLREEEDNDVPFSLYRDEGKTFLMWRGSEGTRERLTGRAVLVRLACWIGTRLLLPCAAFRVSGTAPDSPSDMTSVFFSLGAAPAAEREHAPWAVLGGAGMGAPLLLCALVATLLYAGALLLYLRARRRLLQPRPVSKLDGHPDMDMPNTKTNPLLSLDVFMTDSRRMSGDILTDKEDSTSRAYSSQSSSRTDSLNDRSKDDEVTKDDIEEFDVIQPSTVSATIHRAACSARLGPPPPRPGPGLLRPGPQNPPRPGSTLAQQVERRPEQHVAIVEEDDTPRVEMASVVPPPGSARKKLYFNPAFLEPQMLKTPPPAAVEFLSKIREVIGIAKDKMQAKRFVQILPTIAEEHFCRSAEPGFSSELYKSKSVAFSLKRENSRRKSYCSGCPGCKTNKNRDIFLKTLSEKKFCKTCISGDLKHNIVKKWLDDVPLIETSDGSSLRLTSKSVTKIQGTPKSIEPVVRKDSITIVRKIEPDDKKDKKMSEVASVIKSRKKLPPPPAPPQRTTSVTNMSPQSPKEKESLDRTSAELKKKDDDVVRFIPPELKQKMNAVINELSKFRRVDPILPRLISSPVSEVVTPFIPKLVVSIIPKVVIPEVTNPVESINPHVKLSEHVEIKTRFRKKFEADSLERGGGKRRASLSNIDFTEVRPDPQRSHKRRSSIIAMDELEPMRKIYEMNTRLSKSYQGIDATSEALEKMNKKMSAEDNSKTNCKSYAIQRTNLVSEVYINDYVNTMSSTSDSDVSVSNVSLNIKYTEPVSRPGQLVIKVDNPDRNVQRYCDDFDADTLDRKPEKLKIHSDINFNFTSPKAKTFEQIFLKSSGSFKAKSLTELEHSIRDNDFSYHIDDSKNNYATRQKKPSTASHSVPYFPSVDSRYDALLENQDDNDYENCVLNRDVANTNFRSLSSIFLKKKEQVKPPLPPKKVVGNRQECVWNKQNTYKVHLPGIDNQLNDNNNNKSRSNTPSLNFRITRSEPPPRNILEDSYYPKIQVPKVNKTIRNYTTFGSMDYSFNNRPEEVAYKSTDPNYENYSPYADVYRESFRSVDEGTGYLEKLTKLSKERDNFSMKKPLRRSTRHRQKRIQQTKQHKTEDSGYLSSDSNESRQRSKFILQVREKHEVAKETVTDTDDLESLGDARSESGGESIETNSVFFGSFRRAGPVKGRLEKQCKEDDSGFNSDMLRNEEEKELRSVISIISPRGRLAALDDL